VNNRVVIYGYGVEEDTGNSVVALIHDYSPFFYLKLPEKWTKNTFNVFIKTLKEKNPGLIPDESKLVSAVDFFGFRNGLEEDFLKLSFKSLKAFDKLRYQFSKTPEIRINGKKQTLALYESNLDPILRFFHITGVLPCSGIEVSSFTEAKVKTSNCNIEVSVNVNDLKSYTPDKPGKFLQASFDIECYSSDGSFPKSSKNENVITHISTVYKIFGESEVLCKHTVSLNSDQFEESENAFHTCVETETDLLKVWKKDIIGMDPDILYTYNGDNFDCEYIFTRAKFCGVDLDLGKIRFENSTLKTSNFSSSAYGSSRYNRVTIPGRINFDIFIYIQREFKEPSYTLDDISKKYLGKQKNDMTVHEMFSSYSDKDYSLSRKVAKYCEQDSTLPLLLVDKFSILQNGISMSNVTFVPFTYLIFKGQQIKVFSQILKETAKKGYLVPTFKFQESSEKFTGATVMDPKSGVYYEPITVLDFASLYPSIIRAKNLCYSSFVNDPKYLGIPGVEYADITWEDSNGSFKYTFVQNNNSILPGLLEELGESRKYAKKQMALYPKGHFQRIIWDKMQLAYKVSMNSIYGFLGANMIRCKPIAATVTAVGREMIHTTAEYIETKYPECSVVYGDTDSVFFKSGRNKKDSIEFGKVIAKEVTDLFNHRAISLEFEKIYDPLILYKKKRYSGALFSKDSETPDYIDSKGIVLKRRDNCDLLKNIYSGTLDLVMNKKPQEAISFLQSQLTEIRSNGICIDDLVISKTIKEDYKNKNLPHVVVAEKMRSRGIQVNQNQRVNYVFIKTQGKKNEPQYKKAEDPDHVKDFNLQVDIEYYILKQLQVPLTELLNLITSPEKIKEIFEPQ
jgi:DNA polymerase delta subunit 1